MRKYRQFSYQRPLTEITPLFKKCTIYTRFLGLSVGHITTILIKMSYQGRASRPDICREEEVIFHWPRVRSRQSVRVSRMESETMEFGRFAVPRTPSPRPSSSAICSRLDSALELIAIQMVGPCGSPNPMSQVSSP